MTRRPASLTDLLLALLFALLLALFGFLLPGSRQEPRSHFQLPQSAVINRNLSIAIYRFWSGAVPFCELYFQFSTQSKRPHSFKSPIQSDAGCGEQLASLHGCQQHPTSSIRSHYPDAAWDRIEDTTQPSAHQTCRYQGKPIVL